MRRLIWATLFLAIIGFASAAILVSVSIPGTIQVVRPPSLSVNPASFGTIQLTGIGILTGTAPLTITNNGGVALTLAYSCICPLGISLSLSPVLGPLAAGASWTGTVTFTVDSTVAGGNYPFQLVIEG